MKKFLIKKIIPHLPYRGKDHLINKFENSFVVNYFDHYNESIRIYAKNLSIKELLKILLKVLQKN